MSVSARSEQVGWTGEASDALSLVEILPVRYARITGLLLRLDGIHVPMN